LWSKLLQIQLKLSKVMNTDKTNKIIFENFNHYGIIK